MHHDSTADAEKTERRSFFEQTAALILATATTIPASGCLAVTRKDAEPPIGSALRFFPGFEAFRIDTGEAVINGVKGGKGPPLLLLHGSPQSHVEWHKIAPTLAENFTVVATDLRGYGDSSKPENGENHEAYSKRAMARDQIEVMRQLGFEKFNLVAHDRGARVAHRMSLDHPDHVAKLVLLDIVPTYTSYKNVTREFATMYFHWFFFIQPEPIPETLLAGQGEFYLKTQTFKGLAPGVITDDAFSEYRRCFDNPRTLHAIMEDYRAGASIDLEHDQADLDKKIQCPLLVLWGSKGVVGRLYDVLGIWQKQSLAVEGKGLPGGHWLAEQLPDELYGELMRFLV